jgi:hypothetical protein
LPFIVVLVFLQEPQGQVFLAVIPSPLRPVVPGGIVLPCLALPLSRPNASGATTMLVARGLLPSSSICHITSPAKSAQPNFVLTGKTILFHSTLKHSLIIFCEVFLNVPNLFAL